MMISTVNWAWPQYMILAIFLIAVIMAAANHGKPKEDQFQLYNVHLVAVRWMVLLFLLLAGGFFR